MAVAEVTSRETVAGVLAKLAALPAALSGGDDDASRTLLAAVADRQMELLAERFDALSQPGGTYGPTGERWADNAPATIARKKKRPPRTAAGRRLAGRSGRGYAIGVDSGDMRQAFEVGPDGGPSNHPQQVYRFERGAVVVGIKTPPDYPERFAERRPLVPDEWPDEWNQAIGQVAGEAVARAIVVTLGG